MTIPFQSIEAFAGATGVGALCLLAVFLMIDGRESGVFPTIEFYAKTATWGIVAAIPVLSISYVIGLLFIGFADLLMEPVYSALDVHSAEDLVKISKAIATQKSSALIETYLQLRQEQEILGGGGLAFILLAFGACSEVRNLSSLRKVIYFLATLTAIVGLSALGLSIMKMLKANELASLV